MIFQNIKKFKIGSAMILTMFILAGMLVVALSGSYIIVAGIKAGGTQAQSTKAYFAAEAGLEDILYQVRKENLPHTKENVNTETPIIMGDLESTGVSYKEYFTGYTPTRVFVSVGEYQSAKRSVEANF
jgi:5-bromo-4-chloroindolyl phosphate hydrolysis protein